MCKMPRDGDASGSRDPSSDRETPDEKSFVKKMKSRVSGFLPSSLTKWLGGSEEGQKVRQRDELDDDDEESFSLQPPTKRVKRPADVGREALNYNSTPIHGVKQSFERFPEPIAIPSTSRSTRSLVLPNITSNGPCNVDLHNGDKGSDSGESTSGYSSLHRIGSKEQVSDIADKPCPASSANSSQTALNRSIFHSTMTHERTLFPDKLLTPSKPNSSLSSRRPAFNVSTFGTPNFMDRTLSTKRIVDSPFYSGRTTYGGASAYSQRLHRSPTDESGSSQKTFVQAKPVNKQLNKTPTLSKTAKRILDTLEQYTSSRDEVKKIPNPTKRLSRPEGLISKYTGANPYLARDPRVPSNKELIVPTVTDLLKMKMKERLQDSTVSVREIAAKSNSILNKEEYTLRIEDDPETSKKNNTGKMKTKVASVRQKPPETESIETVNLPDIRLPISTLPTFGFSIPSPSKTTKEPTVKPKTSTEKLVPPVQSKPEITPNLIPTKPTETKDSKQVEYKFSKPLVIAQNLKSIKAINNFKFSEPLCTKKKQQQQDNKSGLANFKFTSVTIPAPVKKTTPKNNGESGLIGPAKELVAGSVMDILGKKSEDLMAKFKPAEGTWECNICMIRNTSEKKKCAACETPRASPSNAAIQAIQETSKPQATGFGDQFKLKSDQWRCETCFVENAAERTSCAACECPKVNKTTLPVKPISSTFGSEFKMSSDKWECSACFVRNNNSDTKCVACTTPKPGLKEEPKPTVSTWECQACWVRNKIESAKCVACETVNPNSPKEDSLWQCSICSAKNNNSSSKCSACQSEKQLPDKTLNVSLSDKKLPTFTFGINTSQEKEPGFTFGITQDNVKKTSSTSGFVFGETKVQTATPPSFTFGKSLNPTQNQPAQSKTTEETSKTFSFGMPVKREREDDTAKDTKAIKPTPINGDINSKPTTTTTESKLISFASVPSSTTASIFGSKTTNSTVSAFGEKPSLPQDAKTNTSGTSNNTSKVTGVSGVDSTSEPTKDKSINIFSNLSTPPAFNLPNFSDVPIFNNSNTPTTQASSVGFGIPKPATTKASSGGFNFTAGANKSSGGFPYTSTPPTNTSTVNANALPFSSAGMQSSFGSTKVSSNAFNVPTMSCSPSAPTFGVPLGGSPSFGATNTGSVFGAASSTPAVPSFGAPSQPAANGAFNFGASALSNTPKTGFNFGAGPSIQQSGGFNFGSNTMSQPNSTPAPAPAFNFAPPAADTKSAFTFSAPPQTGGETKQRVIRRALRRTQR